MKNKVQNQLSFEPLYHRKISQGKYTPISLKSIKLPKGAGKITPEDISAERVRIIAEGFSVSDNVTELSRAKIEHADKGDVASVIANTNPLFRLHNS